MTSTTLFDDAALMLAWRDGDEAAFAALYRQHKLRLLRFLVHSTGSAASGEEVFQEVWLTLIRQRERYRPEAKFSTWLLEIAHSRLVDWYRRNKRHQWDHDLSAATDIPDHCPLPEAQAANRQLQQQLSDCLRQLPPEQREAFLFKEEYELGLSEIAALTGRSSEAVKSRVRYAINKLRQCLGGDHE